MNKAQMELFPATKQLSAEVYAGSPGHARASDTSEDAARLVKPTVTDRQQTILSLVRKHGTLTVFEADDITRWGKDTTAPRFTELKLLGFIEDSGKRRPSPRGRNATAWRATDRSAF